MVVDMKVSIIMGSSMVMGILNGLMVLIIEDSFILINFMDKEFIYGGTKDSI